MFADFHVNAACKKVTGRVYNHVSCIWAKLCAYSSKQSKVMTFGIMVAIKECKNIGCFTENNNHLMCKQHS